MSDQDEALRRKILATIKTWRETTPEGKKFHISDYNVFVLLEDGVRRFGSVTVENLTKGFWKLQHVYDFSKDCRPVKSIPPTPEPVETQEQRIARESAERQAKLDAQAAKDAAEKEYWTERAQKQQGENSLQCLQRYRRERVLAGKEAESSFAPPSYLAPVLPAGITVNDPTTGSQQLIPLAPDKPRSPDAGNWNVNDALVTTAKARNRS